MNVYILLNRFSRQQMEIKLKYTVQVLSIVKYKNYNADMLIAF